MRVESPRPIIYNPDSSNLKLEVLVNEQYWQRFEELRRYVEPIAKSVEVDVKNSWLERLAVSLSNLALFTTEEIGIELNIIALALFSALKRVAVSAYRIVDSPGLPHSFPMVFGDERYEIEPIN